MTVNATGRTTSPHIYGTAVTRQRLIIVFVFEWCSGDLKVWIGSTRTPILCYQQNKIAAGYRHHSKRSEMLNSPIEFYTETKSSSKPNLSQPFACCE